MAERLSQLAAMLERDEEAFLDAETSPFLVWQEAPATRAHELVWTTVPHFEHRPEPPTNDPLVFRIAKGTSSHNAFGVGITLGRTANNDIAVDDPSISRFHAYFQRDEKSGVWHVVDAESFNGTFCDGVRLAVGRPAPLHDHISLEFGSVHLRFYLPEGLVGLMRLRHRGGVTNAG